MTAPPPPVVRPYHHTSVPLRVTMHGGAPSEAPERAVARVVVTGDAMATDDEAEGGIFYVRHRGTLVRIDLSTGAKREVTRHAPIGQLFITRGVGVFTANAGSASGTVTLDLATGRVRWRRGAIALGAANGIVLANADRDRERSPPGEPAQDLVGLDARSGSVRWRDVDTGCAPTGYEGANGAWAAIDWSDSCGSSANESFVRFVGITTGALEAESSATGFLARDGHSFYLTGDDRHYDSYGPGNVSVYARGAARPSIAFPIAPDPPVDPWAAFQVEPAGYAVGAALWVRMTADSRDYVAAVYRYEISSAKQRPGRVDPTFGRWLGAASGDETYFVHGTHLFKVVANGSARGDAYAFAGHFEDAGEVVVLGRYVYVRSAGTIAVLDRWSRRDERELTTVCSQLDRVAAYGKNVCAFCSSDAEKTIVRLGAGNGG